MYVRCGDDAALLARIRSEHPRTVIEPPSAFASIQRNPAAAMTEGAVLDFSKRYAAEVVYLLFVSSTDSFAFTHCDEGRCVRHLRYGCDREERWWEDVTGEPEPWERAALFGDEDQSKDIDDDDPQRLEVEEIFRLGRVRVETGWPILDAREAARAVAVHFRLTDWLDDWAEGRGSGQLKQVTTPSGAVITMTSPVATRAPARPATVEPTAPKEPAADVHAVEPPPDRTKRPWWRFW